MPLQKDCWRRKGRKMKHRSVQKPTSRFSHTRLYNFCKVEGKISIAPLLFFPHTPNPSPSTPMRDTLIRFFVFVIIPSASLYDAKISPSTMFDQLYLYMCTTCIEYQQVVILSKKKVSLTYRGLNVINTFVVLRVFTSRKMHFHLDKN